MKLSSRFPSAISHLVRNTRWDLYSGYLEICLVIEAFLLGTYVECLRFWQITTRIISWPELAQIFIFYF